MEKKLIKERNTLLIRIMLILFAVWLFVSVTYCAVRLYNEESSVKDREISNLTNAHKQLSIGTQGPDEMEYFIMNNSALINFKDSFSDGFDSQMIVRDRDSDKIIADTSDKITVLFGFETQDGLTGMRYGVISHKRFTELLSDEQYKLIKKWLETKNDNGRYYEAVCTKAHVYNDEYIPLEIQIVLTDGGEIWLSHDKMVETIKIRDTMPDMDIFTSIDVQRNIIPKEFILSNEYNEDIISGLTDEQMEQNVIMIPTGLFKYTFYSSDYMFLNVLTFSDDESKRYVANDNFFMIQYAKRIDLLENCMKDLIIGTAVLFAFFFIIGVILYFMIWKMVKAQMIQERKRADLTNALAHDIKTPLFVISGYAYSLKEDIDSSEREIYIDKIIEQTDEINGLVHNMLSLSKLDSYAMKLNKTEFDLNDMTDTIVNDRGKLPDGKTIVYSHSGDNTINADKELIKSALQNLIDNALKYSPNDSEIIISLKDKTISIANPGEQMSRSELKKLWQPYVRGDKSRSKSGNGLGLSIVKSILDLHGAEYDLTMKNNIFEITLSFS